MTLVVAVRGAGILKVAPGADDLQVSAMPLAPSNGESWPLCDDSSSDGGGRCAFVALRCDGVDLTSTVS